jgi:PKD domain
VVVGIVLLLTVVPGWSPPGAASSHAPIAGTAAALAPTESRSALAPGPAATAPTLTVPGLLPTAASLSWTASATFNFDNYTVYQSANGSTGPWQPIGYITKATTTTFVAGSLTPGSEYWWELTASSTGLFGAVTTETSNVATAQAASLSFLNVTLTDPTTAELTWTNNATYGGSFGFQWYDIDEVAGTAPPGVVANVSTVGTHQASISPLSAGASYAFYVNTSDCTAGCGTTAPTVLTTQSNIVTLGTPETLVASINDQRSVVDVGQLDLFTCTPSGGRSPYHIAWNDGNGTFEPGPGTESLAFNAPGNPSVQCKITDADASTSEDGTSITVNSAPTLVVDTNRTAADVGGSITFDCAPSGGTAPFSVAWDFGDGSGVGLGDTTHAYTAPARLVATCTATDFTGTEVGGSVAIDVSPLPDLTLSVNSFAAAPGTALSFTGHVTNGSGNASALSWTFGDGAKATGPTTTHAFTEPASYDVVVRTVDSNGVPAVANATIRISTVTVTVQTLPATVDRGSLVHFNATASGGAGGPYNYTWTFGDGGHAYGPSVAHAFTAVGTFDPTLHVTDRLGAPTGVNLTALTAVTPPAPPVHTLPSWWILLAGTIALVAGTFVALVLYRRAEADSYTGQFRWVPFTDPNRTLKGVRVCKNCGTPNNAAREGCSACGAPIGPSIFG